MKQPTKWAINEVRGLPTFVSGRVALLGDAVSLYRSVLHRSPNSRSLMSHLKAHAMTPHLGSGAGQAVEVSQVLKYQVSVALSS